MGLLGMLLYRDIALSAVMATAMFINLLVAVLVGLGIPLLRHKFGKDPAVGTSVILTAINRLNGVFYFFGVGEFIFNREIRQKTQGTSRVLYFKTMYKSLPIFNHARNSFSAK